MTTITPAAPMTIQLVATLTSPLRHGAGTSGNTAILRTQEVVQPDGSTARVPFVSGASVRHLLRDRIAWKTAEIVNFDTLSKAAVDLMWTGGAVTATGAEVDLDMARRVDEIYPALGLLGYAAQSDIVTGTLRASDLILVCAENAWRLPPGLPEGHIAQRAAAFRSEEFGTRHDVASSPAARLVEAAELAVGSTRTTQMIWDTQVIKAGSILSGSLSVTPSVSPRQTLTLAAALALWAPDGAVSLGAKSAQGYGSARLAIDEPTLAWAREGLAWWESHTAANADHIKTLVRDLAR